MKENCQNYFLDWWQWKEHLKKCEIVLNCNILFVLLFIFSSDYSFAQRLVQVQDGPLYRANGYPITIACNVSGFKGPSEQNFEFSMYLSANPTAEIKIISTLDPSTAYAIYRQRVKNKEIEIERITGSSVLLHIKNLQQSDQGQYECSTPNTDGTYLGSYSAMTDLKVIQDTLTASMSTGPLRKLEGDPLQLECEVSSQTLQHTHISVTWYLRKAGQDPLQIISLMRDFTLTPGSEFEYRYKSGQIGLDKIGITTYRLTITHLQVADQGNIYCQAGEWIQDPDKSWFKIASKETQPSSVEVQKVDKETDDFNVRIEATEEELQEGETLELKCIVEIPNILDHYFSVAWFKDSQEMARIGPMGVLTIGGRYTGRESQGEIRVFKKSGSDYVIIIKHIKTKDQGAYHCSVSKEEKSPGGPFTTKEMKESSQVQVQVTALESNFNVAVSNRTINIVEGDHLQISCKVAGMQGQVSVAWQYKKDNQNPFSDVISLSLNGALGAGAQYRQRIDRGDIRTVRINQESFVLEMSHSLPSDAGIYRCVVTDWIAQTDGNWKERDSKSQESSLTVSPLDSVMRTSIKSRHAQIEEGKEITLICSVSGTKVPLSTTWKFQKNGSSQLQDIVTLHYNGDIKWHRELNNFEFKTSVHKDDRTSFLKVSKASILEAGTYQCVVEAWISQTKRAKKESNMLAIIVTKPGSKLTVRSEQPVLERNVNGDVEIACQIQGATNSNSQFAVSWYFTPSEMGNTTILKMDRYHILENGEMMKNRKHKFQLIRQSADSYKLVILQTEFGDSGKHYCVVEEWVQDPNNKWYALPQQSAETQLIIRATENNVRVLKNNTSVRIPESNDFIVNCTIDSDIQAMSHFSVTWYYQNHEDPKLPLLTFSHDSVFENLSLNKELWKRMQFYSPSAGTYSLVIRNAGVDDTGKYSCKVDEYVLNCEGNMQPRSTGESGFTEVVVHHPENNLHVSQNDAVINLREGQGSFTVYCNITTHSNNKSAFEVTWLKTEEGITHPIFKALRNSTLQFLSKARDHFVFNRPSTNFYSLTLPMAKETDAGIYFCNVEEWLLNPRHKWYKIAERTSGNLTVSITPEGSYI
ncbi:IGSF3 protein, partial [Amia calva]|nr:IGSF3 protein [Amia calva]